MFRELAESRKIKMFLLLLALALITREAFDLFTYPDSRALPPPVAEHGNETAPALSVTPQALPAAVPPGQYGGGGAVSGRPRQVRNASGSGGTGVLVSYHAPPVQPAPCSEEASGSQVAILLSEIAKLKIEDPVLQPALAKIEAELSRATGGHVCLADLQHAVKSLCVSHPGVEEAFKALQQTLPLLVRFVAGDPCHEDLGTFLNVLNRLHPEL